MTKIGVDSVRCICYILRMMQLNDFISDCPVKMPPMSVQVLDKTGKISQEFGVPAGFQLEKYVAALYPKNELMTYTVGREVNVSVTDNLEIIEIYRGLYK